MLLGNVGFGVPGALSPEEVKNLAAAAEAAGYQSFWVNDTPNGDGLVALQAAAAATSRIRLGVGVIPVDRKPATEIAKQIADLGLPTVRLMVGVGSGGMRTGALAFVRSEVAQLKSLTDAAVAVGALGPRMVQLGAESADGILLNWLTPAQARSSSLEIARFGVGNDHSPEVIAYVRVAVSEGRAAVEQEAARYASYPQYSRHFHAMGVAAIDTCVIGNAAEIGIRLGEYRPWLDEVVIRAVPAEESLEGYLAVLQGAARGLATANRSVAR